MGKLPRKERYSSSGKRFSALPICLKIKDEVDKDLSPEALSGFEKEMCPFISDLYHFNDCNMTEALKCIKEISAHVSDEKNSLHDAVLRALVCYFIIAEPKTPLKRAIASILGGLKRDDMIRKTQDFFDNLFHWLLKETLSQSCIKTGRHVVDLLTVCSSGCTLGREFIQAEIGFVLIFLHWFLESILSEESQANNGKDFENDVCTTLKCAVSIFKKHMDSEFLRESDRELIDKILSLSKDILTRDTFGWDCHNAAGMTWVTIWKISYDNKEFLPKVAHTIGDMKEDLLKSTNTNRNSDIEPVHINKGLSFCSGIMVTLSTDDLVQEIEPEKHNQECLIFHSLLPFLKAAEQVCKSISHQVILAKCFAKWTVVVLERMKRCIPDSVKDFLLGEKCSSSLMTDLTSYAFTKLEHPTDAIRHQANEMLVNLLGIGAYLNIQDFTLILVKNVMSQNWQKRSTFTALNCILPHVSPEDIFQSCPNIALRLLNAMKHQSLAPYASETYKVLLSKVNGMKKSPNEVANDAYLQLTLLIDPVVTSMCDYDLHSLRLLIDYCFVKILNSCGNDCLVYMFNVFQCKLSSCVDVKGRTQTLAAFLSCVKMATSKGHVKDDDATIFSDKYHDLTKSCLVHEDNEVRHLAFALLCESVKPSSLVSIGTLSKLRYALPFNVSCQDPAFRQKLTNSLKKLLTQLRGNMVNLKKMKVESNKINERSLFHAYQGFITWLIEYVTLQIYASAPYPKRVTCITILTLIVNVFVDLEKSFTVDYSTAFTHSTVQSLFVLLSDPYEDIKQMSFALLKNVNLRGYIKDYMSEEWLDTMLTKALDRAHACSQPECCSDAAYHVKLYCALNENQSSEFSVTTGLYQKLLKLLNESVDLANKNLYLAATSSPMYGLLHCLKSLLQTVKIREIENVLQWRHLVSCTIEVCLRVSNAVLPVVGSISPEGHLPEVEQATDEEVTGGVDDAWNELSSTLKSLILDEQDERKTRALAQQVLICCWRSAKESSLLLQEVTSDRFPLDSSNDSCDGVLSWSQIISIGEHLRKQLMEARHRGAFEIAYYAFKAYCPRLWNTEHQELKSVPKRWLESSLSDIQDPSRSKDLCATRRSAGLPFLMQALLSANKSAEGKRHLHNVMMTLLHLCEARDTTGVITKVHALNILRGLVKDASLGEEILPYVSECMQVSLTGFSSALWSVRNSSTLLFSALFTRIFGVKRDKNDDSSLNNRLSGNEFFSRLPGLHPFLVKNLAMICTNLNKGGHHALCPTLHPILLLLSRIYPSTMQPTSGIGLDDFIPLLVRCRASAVYKSRVANASALASILSWDQHLLVLRKCCDNLVRDVSILRGNLKKENGIESSPQNRVHGGLLQIGEIIRSYFRKDQSHDVILSDVTVIVHQALLLVMPFLSSRKNRCPLTRAVSLEIFFQVHENLDVCIEGCNRDGWLKLTEDVKMSCFAELENLTATLPSFSFLIRACAKVAILLPKKNVSTMSFASLLSTKSSDSLAALLNVLSDHWVAVERYLLTDDCKVLETQLVNLIQRGLRNDQIGASVYQILSKIASSQTVNDLFHHALEAAKSCNAAQSALLEALLKFQSSCMVLVAKKNLPMSPHMLDSWINVLSSASKSYENTDGVRFAVANSLLDNCPLLSSHEELLGDRVVQLWKILIDLLCDEESDVRKVACYVAHQAARQFDVRYVATDHPCVDNLAIIHAIVTMILTRGRKHKESCRRTLQTLARSESTIVPVSIEDAVTDENTSAEDSVPGLFARSEINTYFDAREVSRIANVGLDILQDIDGSLELNFLSITKKFE